MVYIILISFSLCYNKNKNLVSSLQYCILNCSECWDNADCPDATFHVNKPRMLPQMKTRIERI